ncbi:hypothetical protein [Nocardia sp. 348MFTsu5.1]|uniref:hypothetical protein n=1 Tax=Nocardia sp. 348MFTsu5.1 TaxID=1172185 RepID=UPI00039BD68B|nr:hypothetical protein [Nocardia sp. 348MFTsu5.1]
MNSGMTADRFAERLWQVISEINCGGKDLSELMRAYPDRHTTADRAGEISASGM